MSVAAIIVAAGPGTRLGAGVPKAFVLLRGEPLVLHALRGMLSAPQIDEAIVVVPPALETEARRSLDACGHHRLPITIVAGGAERQSSVRKGIEAVQHAEFVAIHDAARPFVTRADIQGAIDAARVHGAAIVATPATDTVKIVRADGRISATPPRGRTWLAQTPQVFRTDIIRDAHCRADSDASATDDAMLVERLGHPVVVIAGDPSNRKITTRDDLQWAEWHLDRSTTPR